MSGDITAAVEQIRRRWTVTPVAGVILGSGLGGFSAGLEIEASISYDVLPGFPKTTVAGHAGYLHCGRTGTVGVVALSGRGHFYEGYTFRELAAPVEVAARMGARVLVISNASGGLNPRMAAGDLMLVCDHINLMGRRTARGDAERRGVLGRSLACYDRELIDEAITIAMRHDIRLHRGVYVGVTGPNYETRAEYRALRRLGGDAVGMSTIPEVLAAVHCGLRVLAISAIANVALPDSPTPNDSRDIIDRAAAAEPMLRTIVSELVSSVSLR
jgi:purine-nucleoside phosphorylase